MPTFSRRADVHAVLTDPRFTVPPVPGDAPPGTIGWLRANVARFSTGPDHRRRRALAVTELERVDVADLRHAAARRTAALPHEHVEAVARRVPVEVLAGALGVPGAAARDVATVARAYHPHSPAGPEADAALARLVGACGGTADELTAARIGLLVQTWDATARLVATAGTAVSAVSTASGVPAEAAVAHALADDPPVRVTRRHARDAARVGGSAVAAGSVVELDLADADLGFGAGAHECPGQAHAVALACGVLDPLAIRKDLR
ncbi:oxidoreductase [Qaidamihabitans albus]|uniref:oxidoreductase n=1 Tax=Qaidamihabitans albus TaxID=2795733 RepID=UPI0018F169B3|nr:oxidoreductase [Qaidamihabitans albus]